MASRRSSCTTIAKHLIAPILKSWWHVTPECMDVRNEYDKLMRLSPEEPVFALVIAASRACLAGDDEEKRRYKQLLCNCKYTFIPMTDASCIRRKAIDLREEMRTALGLVAMGHSHNFLKYPPFVTPISGF